MFSAVHSGTCGETKQTTFVKKHVKTLWEFTIKFPSIRTALSVVHACSSMLAARFIFSGFVQRSIESISHWRWKSLEPDFLCQIYC